MAKKLIINCATCDTRSVTEETLNAYEKITINCANVIVSPESKALLNAHDVTMNCANVRELEKDVRVQTINGKMQIRSADILAGKTFLTVNGKLDIGPNTQEVLAQYVGITVNGKVTCPESLSGSLGMLNVNGKTVLYPDDAIVLKPDAVIDRTFALRAKERRYWSEKRMIFVDPKLNPETLVTKGATFCAEEVLIAESFVEKLIDSVDEKAEIIIVPDGTAVVLDELKLDGLAVKKYGTKLYILDDVDIDKDSRAQLEQLEYLNIRGDVKVPGELKELLLEKASQIDGDIIIKKGRYISDKVNLRISKAMLELEPDGIQVEDCVTVKLDADIPGELILKNLSLRDCVIIHCTPEQEDMLHLVSEDVGRIETGEEKEEKPSDIDPMINATEYVL